MRAIQAGKKLKHVDPQEARSTSSGDALASILRTVLEKREKECRYSSDSEGEQTDEWSDGNELD